MIDLVMFYMDNVLIQLEDNFYSQTTVIILGDKNSVSMANIAMNFIMLSVLQALKNCEL